jgi:hypothetical protein
LLLILLLPLLLILLLALLILLGVRACAEAEREGYSPCCAPEPC